MALPQHLLGRTPVLGPSLLQQSTAAHPKNTYSGSLRDTFAQGLLKTSVPWVPTRWVEYPHGPSIMPMGSHPCALTLSLATLWSYPCSTIVRMTPPLDSFTHSLSENGFSHGTHLPCMAHLQHPRGRTTRLCPGLWQQSTTGCQKNYYKSPCALLPKVSLKTSFPWVPTRRIEYPHGPSIIPTGWNPWTLTRS